MILQSFFFPIYIYQRPVVRPSPVDSNLLQNLRPVYHLARTTISSSTAGKERYNCRLALYPLLILPWVEGSYELCILGRRLARRGYKFELVISQAVLTRTAHDRTLRYISPTRRRIGQSIGRVDHDGIEVEILRAFRGIALDDALLASAL